MTLTVRRCDLHRVELRTRMPFRYGIATMTHMPMVFVRVWLADENQETVGISSDLLPPKWFTKIPEKAPETEIAEMLEVISHAQTAVSALQGESVFDLWHQLYAAQDAWATSQRLPPLLAHFGTSLVERAIIEAFSRARRSPFHQLVKKGELGIDLSRIHPSLNQQDIDRLTRTGPRGDVLARHTIGLGDPLTDHEIPEPERVQDGLPQSLSACIRRYGLRHFKIKVSGKAQDDLDRLRRVADILETETKGAYAFSLDGNEQFQTMDAFRQFWESVRTQKELGRFMAKLLFVEQPLHRARALEPAVGPILRQWRDAPPLIIDESDGELGDAARAIQLGYAGTSHKNCKGVFKGLANRCLLARQAQTDPDRSWIMSGEDLCNMGPVGLLQDLAVMGTLGIESVERNGHHYNAGLSQFPPGVQEAVLAAHPDLYQRSELGWPTLRIEHGRIPLGSVNRAPFGVQEPLIETVMSSTLMEG